MAKSYTGSPSRLRPRNQSNARTARSPCARSSVATSASVSASTRAAASSGCSSPSSRAASRVTCRGANCFRPAGPPARPAALGAVPAQRVEAGRQHRPDRPAARPPRSGLRQPRIVVGETAFEPTPTRPSVAGYTASSRFRVRSSSCRIRARQAVRNGGRVRPMTAKALVAQAVRPLDGGRQLLQQRRLARPPHAAGAPRPRRRGPRPPGRGGRRCAVRRASAGRRTSCCACRLAVAGPRHNAGSSARGSPSG